MKKFVTRRKRQHEGQSNLQNKEGTQDIQSLSREDKDEAYTVREASDERDGGDSDESYIMECEDEPIMQNQLRQLVIVEPESEGIELFLLWYFSFTSAGRFTLSSFF